MKIISWNIRRTCRKGLCSQVRFLLSKYNLDIISLMETRVNSKRTHKIIERINLSNLIEAPLKVFAVKFSFLEK